METTMVSVVIDQTMFVVAGMGMFLVYISPIMTLCYVFRMVESDKIKAKAYSEWKAIQDVEHKKMINEYYANRDAKRAEWLKTIESWSIVETSVNG